MQKFFGIGIVLVVVLGCVGLASAATFEEDVAFMRKYEEVIVLSSPDGKAQVAVCPAYQGRVMTSSAQGSTGASFGWINRELITSREIRPHINVFGGEDRFWMGPEGGQFAIFFLPGAAEFNLENWQTPASIDSEPFETVSKTKDAASFARRALLQNYSGAWFDVQVDRHIRLLGADTVQKVLGVSCPKGVDVVAYSSENTITNKGADPWKKKTGLLSIWILGMYNASPTTTVVVPFEAGSDAQRGPAVNDEYFGKVPAERLLVKKDVLYFRGDAQYRSKIGLSPQRAKPVLGSYDSASGTLTIARYTKPPGFTDYVNSMWEMQDKPYGGDVVNSYNDGPSAPGKKGLGAFYELETSSPALALPPNASATHVHRTFHFQGPEAQLDDIAKTVLGVGLAEIKAAFGK
jgi:hypothetical protein